MSPDAPRPEPLITYRGVVYPWHCDHMGHMNVMWYVGKFDEATWNLMSLVGLGPQFLRDNQRGMAAVEQQIFYRRELLAGATVCVTSEILEMRQKSLRFRHLMIGPDDAVAAETILTGVHIDTGLRKACALDQAVRDNVEKCFPGCAAQ